MRVFATAAAILCTCGCIAAARMLATAESPPAAYAAALLGMAAIGGAFASILILCLTGA